MIGAFAPCSALSIRRGGAAARGSNTAGAARRPARRARGGRRGGSLSIVPHERTSYDLLIFLDVPE